MSLAQYDLNLLVTLDALLQERSITRAGRRIGLSQPATSAALRRLRAMFDDELLVRVGNRHELTPLAKSLRGSLQQMLVLAERTLEQRTAFDPGSADREFRIVASDYWILVLSEALCRRLVREAPGVRLRFVLPREDVVRLLSARRVDLVMHPLGTMAGFESQPLFEDHWTCVVWKGNRSVGKRLDEATFARLPHVQFGMGRLGPAPIDRHLEQLGVKRRIEVKTASFASCPFLVRGTDRIAVMPERLAALLDRASDTKIHALPHSSPKLVETMSWNPLDTHDAAHAWFRGVLADVARGLPSPRPHRPHG